MTDTQTIILRENDILRRRLEVALGMLRAHREFFAERECRWHPHIGIRGAVRVGVDQDDCTPCDAPERFVEQIDRILEE